MAVEEGVDDAPPPQQSSAGRTTDPRDPGPGAEPRSIIGKPDEADTSPGPVTNYDALIAAPIPDSVANMGLPGEHEVWRNTDTDQVLVVIYVPNTDIPLVWAVPDPDVYFSDAGGVSAAVGDNNYTTQEILNAGAMDGGWVSEIPGFADPHRQEHPWDRFVSDYELAAEMNPALKDPEVTAVYYMAYLENRDIFEEELMATDYWQNSTETQREWLRLVATQPARAREVADDMFLVIKDSLRQLGVEGMSDEGIRYIASQVNMGNWTQTYLGEQLRKLEFGELDGLDEGLTPYAGGTVPAVGLDAARARVVSTINQWLGPKFAQYYSSDQIDAWAKDVLNNEDYLARITDQLKDQRVALFPNMPDREVSYDAMASTWRNVWFQTLGEQADENNPLFSQLLRANDLATNEAVLLQHGLNTGNQKVTTEALDGLGQAFGGSVRRIV